MYGGAWDLTAPARIGPNALLQLIPVLDNAVGREARDHLLAVGGMRGTPTPDAMIDERMVALVHQAMRAEFADLAPGLAWVAGKRTGDYILANRIPPLAKRLLRALPARIAGPLLARAVARHAWTFAGSGSFHTADHRPLTFEIAGNPIVRGEASVQPVCDWHAAVFERLFTRLVDDALRCREVTCCAAGAPACRFVLERAEPSAASARQADL